MLDRGRENRSQFVITVARGREMIFWQSARTSKQARPNVALPTARAHGNVLTILVDTGEKYPYSFRHQQATTERMKLAAGDYAVQDGQTIVAAVERKSAADLASTLLPGRMSYLLAEMSALPRAAVVVEEGYSKIFKLPMVAGASVAEAVAEMQARFPTIPIAFCETRALAQEWTYRWLGACLHESQMVQATDDRLEAGFARAPAALQHAAPRKTKPADIRIWAREQGFDVPDRGRIPVDIRRAWESRE